MVADKSWAWGKWKDIGQRVPTFSLKMNELRESNVQRGNYSQ